MYFDNLSIAGILVSLAVAVMLLVILPRWRSDLQRQEVEDEERD